MAIKVLVVDDSAVVRRVLSTELEKYADIEVVAVAPDVYVARDRIVLDKPDVVTLDIEMPRMDGVEFLRRLMPQYPLPVIIVSALATAHADLTLQALEYGAVDFVTKPSARLGVALKDTVDELVDKIRAAAKIDVSRYRNQTEAYRPKPRGAVALSQSTDKIIAVGASTGGTVALERIIQELPADTPGMVVVQHMPPVFTKQFAHRLNQVAAIDVKEAESGDRVLRGRALIAPGEQHLEVVRSGGTYLARCSRRDKVNGHRPSVSVLFQSVAKHVGANAVGVMLTGMGADGADEMGEMRRAGAKTLAQDEATSVVFGMPKEAYARGGAERLVPLPKIAGTIVELLRSL